MADMIYLYLGLQKIKKFWSTPSVLLFLDANSKRYLQKPVVSFMPSTTTLFFCHSPTPWIDYRYNRFRSWKKPGFKHPNPHGDVHTHTHAQCSNLQSWPCFFQKHNSVRTLQKRSRLKISFFCCILPKKNKKQSDLVLGFVGVWWFL